MMLLCIDTATSFESIALVDLASETTRAAQAPGTIIERSVDRAGIHGPHILDDVDALITDAGMTMDAVHGFCVGLGPGSFTGLRISLATLKGLAFATAKPLYGARTTSAMLKAAGGPNTLVILDARRNEVYMEGGPIQAPICCKPEDVWHHVDPKRDWRLIGDGALKYQAKFENASSAQIESSMALHQPQAAWLAHCVDPEVPPQLASLEPVYVRKSDAEINYPDGYPDAVRRAPRSP